MVEFLRTRKLPESEIDAVSEQIVSIVEERLQFSDDLAGEMLVRPLPLKLSIEQFEKPDEPISYYDSFILEYAVNSGIKDKEAVSSLIGSNELRDNFDSLVMIDLRMDDAGGIKDNLLGNLTKESLFEGKKFNENYGRFVRNARRREIARKVFEMKDENPELVRLSFHRISEVNHNFEIGELNEQQFYNQIDEIFTDVIATSGDIELQELWMAYKSQETSSLPDSSFSEDIKPFNDTPVTVESDFNTAFNVVETVVNSDSSGYKVRHRPGGAYVDTGSAIVNLYFRKTPDGKFVFHVVDKFANGVKRVFSRDLLKSLYERNMDAYVARIGFKYGNAKKINELMAVSDDVIVSVCSRLLEGEGALNEITGRKRDLLDNLVRSVFLDDKGFLLMSARFGALNRFLEKKDNVSTLKKVLLSGETLPVSSLLKQ